MPTSVSRPSCRRTSRVRLRLVVVAVAVVFQFPGRSKTLLVFLAVSSCLTFSKCKFHSPNVFSASTLIRAHRLRVLARRIPYNSKVTVTSWLSRVGTRSYDMSHEVYIAGRTTPIAECTSTIVVVEDGRATGVRNLEDLQRFAFPSGMSVPELTGERPADGIVICVSLSLFPCLALITVIHLSVRADVCRAPERHRRPESRAQCKVPSLSRECTRRRHSTQRHSARLCVRSK